MLDFVGRPFTNCDGVSRRALLRVGALGVGAGALTLPSYLQAQAASSTKSRRAVILVWQAGGPSHLDMYDLKPEAPSEIRGEFKPIDTNVSGIQIGEHLPYQAQVMDKLAIVRSAHHKNPGHGMGSHWMMTGYEPTTEVSDNLHPSLGSVVAKVNGPNRPGLPAYCTVPRRASFQNAAYLGASFNPFTPDSDPNSDSFNVRNLKLPGRVSMDRLNRRRELLGDIDTLRRDVDRAGTIEGLDKFYEDALGMVTSDDALRAFDINLEDPKLRERYGRNDLGQSLLLARRLVEAGVTFVTVQAGGGWDTHGNNFTELKEKLLPKFDQGVAALVQDIHDRGIADEVLVMAMGEFGRTPRINGGSGRDHWPGAMSVLFAGAGIRGGQTIGATNDKAEYPTERPCSPGDVLSSMYRVLGIDYHQEFYDAGRRPLAILREGNPIAELLA